MVRCQEKEAMRWTTDQLAEWERSRKPVTAPSVETDAVNSEGVLHDEIAAYCKARNLVVVHSRMDRPSTTAPGIPDFVIALPGGFTAWVECKTRSGKLTKEQFTIHFLLAKAGHLVGVVRSMDEFINLINNAK